MPEHSHAYKMLENFHRDEMRMVHIYQPAMLMKLLKSSGEAKIREIAKFLLSHDQSQIEHYEQITKNMVGRVPTKTRGLTERIDDGYRLKGFEDLPRDEIKDLVSLCQEKVAEDIARRGRRIWEHRVKSEGYISGTARYEVPGRCSAFPGINNVPCISHSGGVSKSSLSRRPTSNRPPVLTVTYPRSNSRWMSVLKFESS
jgi:hypothetical protein